MQPERHTSHLPRIRLAGWRRLERGQALVEYWPTIPIGVAVMISAAMLTGFLRDAFMTTARGLTNTVCAAPEVGPTRVDLEGGHSIELTSVVYDSTFDTTTVSFVVESGSKPAISHWILGIDEATASRIISSSEPYEPWGYDPTTGKYGIKFDIGYEGGDGDGASKPGKPPKAKLLSDNIGRALLQTTGEIRTIVLTFVGEFPKEHYEVTTKAGSDQVSSGVITVPGGAVDSGEGC